MQPGSEGRIRNALFAGFLVAFAVVVLQQRTTYMQLLAVGGLMFVFRPRALRLLGIAIPLLLVLLIVFAAFDLRIAGRLTQQISLSFFWDHLLSIFGTGQGSLASSAEGVDLRLGWWKRLYEKLTAAVRAISKAASKGVIHKAQAARRISRLTKSANAAPAPK